MKIWDLDFTGFGTVVLLLLFFGAFCGGMLVQTWYSFKVKALKKYIVGLRGDRQDRDDYIKEILGRVPDLSYCEDDEL